MDYELAKELRDAGFPQEGRGRTILDPNLIIPRRDDRAYVPTLEELIEACIQDGRYFSMATEGAKIDGWKATSYFDNTVRGQGKTPAEAVARLWLAISKNVTSHDLSGDVDA